MIELGVKMGRLQNRFKAQRLPRDWLNANIFSTQLVPFFSFREGSHHRLYPNKWNTVI